MPAEERIYWHDQQYEVDAGLLSSTTRSGAGDASPLAKSCTLWDKVYHTWALGATFGANPTVRFDRTLASCPLSCLSELRPEWTSPSVTRLQPKTMRGVFA
jgi:hypothetical protein